MQFPQIIAWFIEWAKRYGQESPTFFKWITRAGILCMLITGVPQLLEWANVSLPATWEPVVERVIFFCGLVGAAISAATVKTSAQVVVNQSTGDKTIVVNQALPFTAQVEEKKVAADPTTEVKLSNDPTAPKV